MKKVLVVSDGVFHPSLSARRNFKTILDGMEDMWCEFATSIESLRLLSGGGFNAVTIYLHRKTVSDAALGALDNFVTGGGGFLAVHSASASFKTRERYFEILGGRFVSHGGVGLFELRRSTGELFGDIGGYTVHDELYLHEYDRSNTVHFYADTGGKKEPQVWTRACGRGRVCYFAPGHCARTMLLPGTAGIISGGLRWVSGII